MIEYYANTDIGLHREINQDSYLTITNKNGDFLTLVCDGIGGGNAGDVASGETVKFFEKSFKKAPKFASLEESKDYLIKAINEVNKLVFDLANKHREFEGMGTTLTGILVSSFGILCINVGDSRVYGFADNKIFRLTKDHTLVNQMIDNGQITYEESLTHPQRHYLVRAIGVWKDVEADIHEVKKLDYYMICSDGLCGYVDDEKILEIMNSKAYRNAELKCKALIDTALLAGGYDNITVAVVNYENS